MSRRAVMMVMLLAWRAGPAAWAQDTGGCRRVVSLAPSLTELVCVLDLRERLVGRSSACDYPPAVRDVPVVGGFGRPNLDRLRELRPDLVLATDLEQPALLGALRAEGVRCLALPCESWTQLLQAAREIGAACGAADRAAAWSVSMQERRRRLAAEQDAYFRARPRPRLYIEVWGDPVLTAGRDTMLNDLAALAGTRPLGASLPGRYPAVSLEWVLRGDPDLILLAYPGAAGAAAGRLQRRPGWETIQAVRDNAICDFIDPDLLARPGPRWLDGAEALAGWVRGTFRDRETQR